MSSTDDIAWTEYRRRLLRFVRARLTDEAAAEDLVQEILLRAYRSRDSLRGGMGPWLFRIARNALIDHYRGRRRSEPLPDDLATESPTVDAVRELSGCVRPFVAGLPARYRDALTLAELDGLSQAETARRLGISLSGAKSRVQRGRRMLAERVMACCAVRLASVSGVADYEAPEACASSEDGCGRCEGGAA